ncbi:MAG: NAD(P)-dependent oxidoreductase [Candidatus Omnitrophica bacterium]|nr:NAD(P)-dependent oxidoreductase [Candidatus Omnitrophota bacterium]
MKALVIGATGFIGKRLATRLVEQGHEVICAGRKLSCLGRILSKVKPVYIDIEDIRSVQDVLGKQKPDIVFHCAALVGNGPLKRLLKVNKDGSYNVFKACLDQGVKRAVYLSSIAVISGNSAAPLKDDMPYSFTNRYGCSKVEAEKAAFLYRQKGLKISIIRPVMVYGENEPHLLRFICRLVKKRLIPVIGTGSARIQLVYIDNVVDVMVQAIVNEKAYEGTYIVADKEVLTIAEFLEYTAKCLKAKPPLYLPGFLIAGLSFMPFIRHKVSYFTKDRLYSIDRIKEDLGYLPRVTTYDGLRRAVCSYENGQA